MQISTNYSVPSYNIGMRKQNVQQPQFKAQLKTNSGNTKKIIPAMFAGFLGAIGSLYHTIVGDKSEPMTNSEFRRRKRDLKILMPGNEQYIKKPFLSRVNKNNIGLAEKLRKLLPKIHLYQMCIILDATRDGGEILNFTETLCEDEDFPEDQIPKIFEVVNKTNVPIAEKLCANKDDFPEEKYEVDGYFNSVRNIIDKTNKNNIDLVSKICDDKKLTIYQKDYIIDANRKEMEFVEGAYDRLNPQREHLLNIVRATDGVNVKLVKKMYADYMSTRVPSYMPDEDTEKLKKICKILKNTNMYNLGLVEEIYDDSYLTQEQLIDIAKVTNGTNIRLAKKIYTDYKNARKESNTPEDDAKSYKATYGILRETTDYNIGLAEKLYDRKDIKREQICEILKYAKDDFIAVHRAEELCFNSQAPIEEVPRILRAVQKGKMTLDELYSNEEYFPKKKG